MAPRMLGRLAPDVAHFTNGMMPLTSPVPTVVTIHDMSLALYPRYHPPRRVLLNRPLVDLAVRRADAIITVSQSARRDIVRHYGLRADQVHVVQEAAAPAFRPVRDRGALERVRSRYGLAPRDHPVRRHDRAAKESAEAARGVRAAPRAAATCCINWCASGPTAGSAATSKSSSSGSRSRKRSASPATCRSRICRRSTAWRRCSSFRRSTKASACRSSKRWRAARRSSPVPRRRSPRSAAARSSRSRTSTPSASAARWSSWRRAASGARTWRRSACCARASSRGGAPRGKRSRSTGSWPADRPTPRQSCPRRALTARASRSRRRPAHCRSA